MASVFLGVVVEKVEQQLIRWRIHETRNVGDKPARIASTFVIEKGKPISQPVA